MENKDSSSTVNAGNNKNDNISNSSLDRSAQKVQSAGEPGSAGMVGSKRWMAAHSGKIGKDL